MTKSLKSHLKIVSWIENMNWMDYVTSKILEPHTLIEKLPFLRKNKTIATLNGAFDLIHPGHLYIIHEASCQADILILLLNTDKTIKKNKGPLRPLLSLEERMMHLAALKDVRYVSWFDEPTPCEILKEIKPEVHINGAEYGNDCIEANVVKEGKGRIHLVPRLSNFSTSRMVKILQKDSCV